MFLLYDGSLEGAFTAFNTALEGLPDDAEFAAAGSDSGRAGSLFGSYQVATDEMAAAEFAERVRRSGGSAAVQHLIHAFQAEVANREDTMFRYASLTLEHGRNLDGWLSNDAVRNVVRTSQKVMRETHRMKGLLRFMELKDGTFYAPFEPDHNILPFLAPYFTLRLADQRWVIHDRRRDMATLWDLSALYTVEVDDVLTNNLGPDLLSTDERFYRECWRTFTRRVAIQSRHNPALQRQFMPKKYWKYLPEVTGDTW